MEIKLKMQQHNKMCMYHRPKGVLNEGMDQEPHVRANIIVNKSFSNELDGLIMRNVLVWSWL